MGRKCVQFCNAQAHIDQEKGRGIPRLLGIAKVDDLDTSSEDEMFNTLTSIMSVCIQLGQCGNQLGAAYWRLASASNSTHEESHIHNDFDKNRQRRRAPNTVAVNGSITLPRHLFHPSTGAARCILVDTEPKVVQSLCTSTTGDMFSFRPAFTHVEQAGRGNNWAMGYYGPNFKSPLSNLTSSSMDDKRDLTDAVMESLRREIESVDFYQGSIVMHSLCGGTGAGFGCRIMETMRDTYPKAYIVTASVAPSCTRGDTPLQNYNAILTLKTLQDVADAVIYKDNDDLLRTVNHWKTMIRDQAGNFNENKIISLEEANSIAAADLAGLLFPVTTEDASSVRPFDFGKLLHDVCPMSTAKMLDVRSGLWRDRVPSFGRQLTKRGSSASLFHAPVVTQARTLAYQRDRVVNFDMSLDLLKKLVQQTAGSFPRNSYSALASSTIIRGFYPSSSRTCQFSEELSRTIFKLFPSVPWLSTMPQATVSYSKPAPFSSLQAKVSATICINNGNFLASTTHLLEQAQRQFQAGAYMHWYKQYGMEDADFEIAFDKCASLIQEYKTLLR
ncbi:cryptic tubulin [Plasmopara halstedii]|uniref:Tubulin delta chain n=1 Tax=Plasmopara halstedii TaxID=4781 RepID=A0A0P1B4U3_PLAHL|nr:cryptic tubulin [Plasmopara halstedii]CEG49149.1 cryptic tubulin [Plasmopara halstedii]|eukprot:XP_024585518.1 cryptic tubulin [Plasmopara halstedii]